VPLAAPGETGPTEEPAHQDGEPDFDLVERGGVPTREMKGEAMLGLIQEGGAGGLGGEHIGFALTPSLSLRAQWRAARRMTASVIAALTFATFVATFTAAARRTS
jgi:hypothetical protein